jgi:hypothetical protein
MGEHTVGNMPGQNQPVPDDPIYAEIDALDTDEAVLDALEAALGESVEDKNFTLTVPQRPKVQLVFSTELEYDLYMMWMKRATDKKTKEVDFMKLALPCIAKQNTGVLMDGKRARFNGEDLTITHPRIHAHLKVPAGSTGAAIRKMYAKDGEVIQAMRTIIEKCGYTVDGDVQEVDAEDTPLAG